MEALLNQSLNSIFIDFWDISRFHYTAWFAFQINIESNQTLLVAIIIWSACLAKHREAFSGFMKDPLLLQDRMRTKKFNN